MVRGRRAGMSAKYNTRRNVYAAHRSQEWEERKEKTKEGAWEQRKKEWLEKKREEDTKEYEYDGMGFSDARHWWYDDRLVREETLKNNWQKNKNGKRMKEDQEKRNPRTQKIISAS